MPRRTSYNSSPCFLLDAPRTSLRLKYTSAFEGLQRGFALRVVLRVVATHRGRNVVRDAVYKWTSIDGYASARRRGSQPSERGCIKRHNRRLFKRMRPYGSGFAPPLYARTHNSLNIPRAKRQNTESLFYRVPTPSLLASSFFPQPSSSLSLARGLFPISKA